MTVYVEKQGRVVLCRTITSQNVDILGGGDRGIITEFTPASRRRMMERMNRLDLRQVRCTFLTLTFHSLPSSDDAKAALKRFWARLTYYHPGVSAVWRKEYQERGSIHYHLILFRFPYKAQSWLQQQWTECTGEDLSIVHVKLLLSVRQVMYYVSKYIAKPQSSDTITSLDRGAKTQKENGRSIGRLWGFLGRMYVPWGEILRFYADSSDASAYFMWFLQVTAHKVYRRYAPRSMLWTDEAEGLFFAASVVLMSWVESDAELDAYGYARGTLARRRNRLAIGTGRPTGHNWQYLYFLRKCQGRL